ncbi:MAG: hypothetical protein ACYSWO_19640 [Planctomycetota bacterium]|jgi:hypothetical protein
MAAWQHRFFTITICMFPAVAVVPARSVPAAEAYPPYPDVEEMISAPFDEDFLDGEIVCGMDALRYRMRSNIYGANMNRMDDIRLSQMERLIVGDPEDVAKVNEEIVAFCRKRQAAIEKAWTEPSRRHPATEVCNYQTELIPLAILALRVGEQLTPEAHQAIRDVLRAFRPEVADVSPAMYMHAPGYNGCNAHNYLDMLALSAEVTGDPNVKDATYWGLRRELENFNITGDAQEFNLLEAHWCSSMGYDPMKAYISDPLQARMARMIAERIWINRFLTWSAVVERNTGPGSRMAPGAWIGCSGDRAQFACGVEKPIWVNNHFIWGDWHKLTPSGRWPLDDVEGMVPDLPAYLQDIAWRKQYPNELQTSVQLVPWMNRFPRLPGISNARPEPVLAKYVNYQTKQYAMGSITHAWDASTCMAYMSAWWNDSGRQQDVPLGSPRHFCTLYPHYVFNGASFLDRTEMYFENRPDEPARDEWSKLPGPYTREFAEYGRAGSLQHKNTVIFVYSGRKGDHTGNDLVADKARRVSAGMFLFRWRPGTDGMYINRKPVESLPAQLKDGDWWFIHNGKTYVAVRPLEATHLRGPCRNTLEQRTHHVVLYQDNYVGETIEGITDEQWVRARSGFIVEMGDADEYRSFENFQNTMLKADTEESVDGFVRHIKYKRPGLSMEMKWHCYEEKYLLRRINGRDDPWVKHLYSPEFVVSNSGRLRTHDAMLTTTPDETLWLLSCAPSQTYVAYQPHPHHQLPLNLDSPVGRIECERFPFGKLVAAKTSDNRLTLDIDASYRPFWSSTRWRAEVWQQIGTLPSDILIRTDAEQVTATINGQTMPVTSERRQGQKVWILDPYSRIPRVRDRFLE